MSAEGETRDNRSFDLQIYAQWVQAKGEGNEPLADDIQERFRPEFAVAFEAWQADGMVEASPLVREEYVPAGTAEMEELNAVADRHFQDALDNNRRGDNYSLLTVLFALVLFLTAMSPRDNVRWARWSLLILAIGVDLVGIAIMATFPVIV